MFFNKYTGAQVSNNFLLHFFILGPDGIIKNIFPGTTGTHLLTTVSMAGEELRPIDSELTLCCA